MIRTPKVFAAAVLVADVTQVFRRKNAGKKYTLEIDDHFGYGSMILALKNGISSLSSLQEPWSEGAQHEFLQALQDPNVDAARSYMTRWDEESKQVVSVYGAMPPLYKEWEKQQKSMND